jgi:hypothetical protein
VKPLFVLILITFEIRLKITIDNRRPTLYKWLTTIIECCSAVQTLPCGQL